MPSRRAASKASRSVTTKVAPMGYSATMRPLAVFSWYSPTNGYVPGLSARTRIFRVLPPGITFSMRSSLLSNSSGPASLLVTTRTKGAPDLTLISSGEKRLFSIVIGISRSAAPATPTAARPKSRVSNTGFRTLVIGSLHPRGSAGYLGLPKSTRRVNLSPGGPGPRLRSHGGRHRATVGHDVGAGDEAGVVGGQEQGAPRDVVRLAHAPQRDPAPLTRGLL